MDALDAIHRRRSVREFTDDPVSEEDVKRVLEAGTWAPSGLNNQPWRFLVVQDQSTREGLAEFTKYGHIIRDAPVSIVVFLDQDVMYDRTKDVQSIGACVENMLLAVESMGLGAVWLGEILNQKKGVHEYFGVPDAWELMAVVALGYPTERERSSTRRDLDDVVWWECYKE